MQSVYSGSLPCDLPSFWRHFWQESSFYFDYLARQGDENVSISKWSAAKNTMARHIDTSHILEYT